MAKVDIFRRATWDQTMIPVKMQPEPKNFDVLVRKPGNEFLAHVPTPASTDWTGKEYWQKALPDAKAAYKSICAYSAMWIPHTTGNHSIDHFVPKSKAPQLAYEWSNFRYVAARFNSRKGIKTILDPFTIEADWFILNFGTFYVSANPLLPEQQKNKVNQTIEILKLNSDDEMVEEREGYYNYYKRGEITFSHLEKMAPFIACEVKRQGLLHNP